VAALISLTDRQTTTLIAAANAAPPTAARSRQVKPVLSARMVTDLIITGYACALALLGTVAARVGSGRASAGALEPVLDSAVVGFVAAAFIVICIGVLEIDLRALQTFTPALRRMLGAFAGALIVLSLVTWLTGTWFAYAGGTIWAWFFLGFGGLAVLHGIVAPCLRASATIRALTARRVAIVRGDDRACARFLDLLCAQKDADVDLVGVFQATTSRRRAATPGAGRSLDDLVALARERRIDEVFLAFPWHADKRISSLVDRLAHLPVDLKLCPDRVGYAQSLMVDERLAGVPIATLHRQPIRDWGRVAKRAIDLIVGATALALLALPLALIALAIKLDSPGPVLFRQQRQGFDHNVFELLKFRTMRYDPDAPFVQARPDDRRVTRLGRWLRRTSLDELPQLLNVLHGEMSLVGPRPHAVALNAAFMRRIERFARRHRVKPGITGLAQVNGWRGQTDTEEKMAGRVRNDLYYIEHWSLMLDLKILVRTVLTGFARRNAY
jgi:Undecaprenyl-phosphate glucose phosphotransferase